MRHVCVDKKKINKLDIYINYFNIFAAYEEDDIGQNFWITKNFEQIVILGNGGVKSTKSYQEDPKLYGYVLDSQRFERILKENIEKGYISVNEKELVGTDNIIFEIWTTSKNGSNPE